ncbi:MAG: hypothetical protein PUP93_05835 [Rhizonema sp. NSF051]|nr:hypothetical protein [Rhizonema sp. NSF051]
MKTLTRFTTIIGLLSTMLVVTPSLAVPQPTLPNTAPNKVLKIQRQSGYCPSTIGLWSSLRHYAGGEERTIIANTSPFADTVQLLTSTKMFVKYRAPLKKTYANCVGGGIDRQLRYGVRFQKGYLSFRLSLPKDTSSKPSAISETQIVSDRPYVRWAITD